MEEFNDGFKTLEKILGFGLLGGIAGAGLYASTHTKETEELFKNHPVASTGGTILAVGTGAKLLINAYRDSNGHNGNLSPVCIVEYDGLGDELGCEFATIPQPR